MTNKPSEQKKQNVNMEKSVSEPAKKTGAEKDPGNELLVHFDITVPRQEIERQIEEVAQHYSADMKLPGFRKGNVPVDIVKKRYQKAITDEALNKIVEHHIYEKIKQDKLKIASRPMIEKLEYQDGTDLKANVVIEVFPEVVSPDLSKVEVKLAKKDMNLEPFDEEKQIQSVLERNKRRKPVKDRAVKDDDILILEVQSKFMDTKRMSKKKELTYTVSRDSDSDIIDLFPEVISKNLNDQVVFTRAYPADYSRKVWAGKTIEHHIQIKNIFELIQPEFNAEFLKTIGFEDEKTFKEKLRQEYDQYQQSQKEEKINSLIIDQLTEMVDFPIPRTIVEQELVRIQSQHAPLLAGMDENKQKEYLDSLIQDIEKNIKYSLIFDAIQKESKIEVNNEDLEKEYKVISERNNFPLAEVRKYYQKSEEKEKLKDSLLRIKLMNHIREKAKIREG
jgi:trigger factor